MKKYGILFVALISVLLLAVSCSYKDDPTITGLSAEPASGHIFPFGGGEVTLSTDVKDAVIYYTLNGGKEEIYSGPIEVIEDVTITAIAKKEYMTDSKTITASYTVLESESMKFVAAMKMGWNLGNTMDGHNNMTPNEIGWQSVKTNQDLMDGVAAQGFGAVRIPVTWGTMIGEAPDYTINSAWINRVEEIVEYVNTAGMKAIINIHHDGADSSHWLSVKTADLTGANKEAIDAKFKGVWKNIATHFKDTGDYLIFEAFNELHDGSWSDGSSAQHARINELNQIFVDTVREVGGENTDRYLVIPGWVTRPSVTVSSLVLPEDTVTDKLIVTIHFYDPTNFTLGATQAKWGAKATSSPGNENAVKGTFASVKKKFVDEGIPVIIGEYGAVNRPSTGASPNEFDFQKYYMEYVTKLAHDCGFVPFVWDNNAAGTGAERSRFFNRNNGEPYNDNTAAIMEVMKKATHTSYSIDDIVAP